MVETVAAEKAATIHQAPEYTVSSLCFLFRPHVDTTRVVRGSFYVTVPCPFVCLSKLSTAAAVCSEFAAVGSVGRRYRSIAARPAPQQHGGRQQMRAVSRLQPPYKAEHRLVCSASPPTLPVRRLCCSQLSAPQGRLNQWAHWARAQGFQDFFLFEGPPTGCGEINFLKLIILLLMLLHDRTNTRKIDLHSYSKGLFLCCAGIVADNSAINAANFLP